MRSILCSDLRLDPVRSVATVEAELRALLAAGSLDLPQPGSGRTAPRWAALAAWGRRDLAVARLAEGHTDAVAILAQAGRMPAPGALYGVWAARSGGVGAALQPSGGGFELSGTVRFCSGARALDRALVVVDPPLASSTPPLASSTPAPAGLLLVEVAVAGSRIRHQPHTWQTPAMDAADTQDVEFDGVLVARDSVLGEPGWYTGRAGFALGGGGVAAVWWGGAAGLLDRSLSHLPAAPDAHQLAHLGELHALLEAADALLGRTAAAVDAAPGADHTLALAALRSAVERVCREVVDRVPRMVGPAALSRDAGLGQALADLQLYVRQHHGERDHAVLGEQLIAARRAR
ncbi:MAG: acyl-CoA dehydrogenase family protein [Pseudonocardia sp.]